MTEPPSDRGYRWPAEWERHAATWLSWPHNRETWPGAFDRVPDLYERLVRVIARYEPVHLLAGGEPVMADARRHVESIPNVILHDIPTNDAWTRDHGPTFLAGPENSEPALVDWKYNAWGEKYPPFDLDDAVPLAIAEQYGFLRFALDVVLEGGSIDGNGKGTVMTTRSCLPGASRNPTLTTERIEQLLRDYLGAKQVLWLPGGDFAGDDTDGHIDQLARFVDDRTVLVAAADKSDVNHQMLALNRKYLEEQADQDGRKLRLIDLPIPPPIQHEGHRLPASYCNFYVLNDAVVVPQFDATTDEHALSVVRECFPGRDVHGLPARELAWGLGSFHCMTQQQCVHPDEGPGHPPISMTNDK